MPTKKVISKTKTKAKAKPAARAKVRVKSVARIDSEANNTHGWFVRVSFGGKKVSKFFSDRIWENKEKALAEAIKFRDKTEKEMGKPRTDRVVVMPKGKGKSTKPSGIRRKVVTYNTVGGGTTEHPVYEVTWSPEAGKTQRTTISIRKYGEKKALEMAKELRLEKEKEIYGRVIKK